MKTSLLHQPRKGLLQKLALACACASSLLLSAARAQQVGNVFYILLENRNFSENETSGGQQIYGSAAAPYLNSLINPANSTSNSANVSWCTSYHNVLSVYNGSGPSIHPSEPNYVWFENGSNLSKGDDNDPYGSGASVVQINNYLKTNSAYTAQNLSGLIQAAGKTWRSYSEGTNQLNTSSVNINTSTITNSLTNTVAPSSAWTVPLVSFNGTSASYVNPYNGSGQYNFAAKHTGALFFPATNGSTVTTANTLTTNSLSANYAPLPQLASDLTNSTCAQFTVITPDQYNDMHTALSAGFTYNGTHYTGDSAQVAQGDNFLSIVVPQIMASPAFGNNGVIVIWTDETEGSNQNDFNHTLTEIVISKLAKGGAYASTLNYTHSSDINTMQKIFQVTANTNSGFLNDAANPSNPTPASLIGVNNELGGAPTGYGTGQAYDLSDLFKSGVIPANIPAMKITPSGFVLNRRTNQVTQTVTVTNLLGTAITTPVYLAVDSLSTNTTLFNSVGLTVNTLPAGAPYVLVSNTGLAIGASVTVTLTFTNPTSGGITEQLNAFSTTP